MMLNMNATNNSLAGKLSINGVSRQIPENNPLQKLVSGMRINGAAPGQTGDSGALASVPVAAQGAESAVSAGSGQKYSSALANFSAEITARLHSAKNDDPKAAQMLAESLSSAASEIKNKFGQEKANEFMSQMLSATDGGIQEQRLSVAVSGFFSQITGEARNNGELYGKLEEMKNFLNKGLELTIEENSPDYVPEEGQQPGLSYSLNKYFGNSATIADDQMSATAKGFNINFERVDMKVNRNVDDPFDGDYFVINLGGNVKPGDIDVSPETLEQVSAFLRNEIGSESAAAYLEQNSSSDFMGAVATSMAIVAQENGQEAAHSFMSYLNQNVSGLMTAANGVQMEGWHLGRDYGNPDAPIPGAPGPGDPPKKLWITNGPATDSLMRKGHQGLTTNWHDQNGVGSEVTVDLNDLYAAYQNSKQAAGDVPMNKPAGNLVNTVA